MKSLIRCSTRMGTLARLAAASFLTAAVLAGCGGSGKVYEPLRPSAIYTFGDGIVDDGQNGGRIYTINSSDPARVVYSLPHLVASGYGLPIKPQAQGGTAWGQGGTRIADLRTQVQSQLAAASFSSFSGQELIILSAGMEDLIQETQAVLAGGSTLAVAQANIQTQVRGYGQAMLQLHGKGARYIYILPPYDLSQSPWMTTLKTTQPNAPAVYLSLFSTFTSALAQEAESVNGQTQSILLSPGFRTRMGYYTDPSNRENNAGTSIVDTALCAGAGATDASLCTDATLITTDGAQQVKYLFADNRHPVPGVLGLLANGSLSELKNRWGEP